MSASDPREPLLSALRRAVDERADESPESKRYAELSERIDTLLNRLTEAKD